MSKRGVRTFLPFVLMGVVILIIALIFIFNFVYDGKSTSAEKEYKITGYASEVVVNEDNSLDIKEKIDVTFMKWSHGIFRQIPIYQNISYTENGKNHSKNYKISVSEAQCTSHEYDFYTKGGNYVLQIGSSAHYANSTETYSITYKVSLGDDKITDFDQFYYNLVGNQWDTTISNINLKVTFEKPISDRKITFYVLENDTEKVFEETISSSTVTFSYSGTLKPFSGITARTVLEEGYFKTEKLSNKTDIIILVCAFALMIAGTAFFFIKNNKNKIVPIVEFSAPDGITPADAGFIIDKTVNQGDMSSLILYWANKGFIKIVENEGSTTLEKLKDPDNSFKAYETTMFNAMFAKSTTYDINTENINVANAINVARTGVKYENEGFFNNSISILRYLYVGIFAVMMGIMYYLIGQKVAIEFFSIMNCFSISLVLGLAMAIIVICKEKSSTVGKWEMIVAVALSIAVLLGTYISLAVILFEMYSNPFMLTIFVPIILSALNVCALFFDNRVEGKDKQVGKVFGLKNFIIHAEKDRIETLAKENPEIFFDILPFAYVFGISGIWVSKFKEIEIRNPIWYQSDADVIGTLIGVRMLSSINTVQFNSARAMVKTTSGKIGKIGKGGGHFGGGHSGGGFGGGGGGRW